MDPVTQILIGIAIEIAGYMIQGGLSGVEKPKIDGMENPTASAGRPIPYVWGDKRINDPNILFFCDKQTVMRSI